MEVGFRGLLLYDMLFALEDVDALREAFEGFSIATHDATVDGVNIAVEGFAYGDVGHSSGSFFFEYHVADFSDFGNGGFVGNVTGFRECNAVGVGGLNHRDFENTFCIGGALVACYGSFRKSELRRFGSGRNLGKHHAHAFHRIIVLVHHRALESGRSEYDAKLGNGEIPSSIGWFEVCHLDTIVSATVA